MSFPDGIPESCLTLAKSAGGAGFNAVHLLVMGLSGAGKSFFVSKATGDTSIPIGPSSFGVTQVVQEYVLYLDGVEVHLIDTPGFDDNSLSDHEVLDKIAMWINTVYIQGWRIGGILYMYDITRQRLGGSGLQNIRILQAMTGKDRWQHLSLITNKWRCSSDHEGELTRERELLSDDRAWKSMLNGARPARAWRFMDTIESAHEIIKWHVNKSFEPKIVHQMADPRGPCLSLGSTDAGRLIASSLTPMLQRQGDMAAQQKLNEVLGRKFNAEEIRLVMNGLLAQLAKAKRDQRLQKAGRWALRLTMVGGSILVSVLAENPAALGFGLATYKYAEEKMKPSRALKKEQIRAMEDALLNTVGAPEYSRSSSSSG